MKISEIYEKKEKSLSFEIFPPKKDSELKNIDATLEVLCELKPDFISVTFGAGGSSNNNRTIELAKKVAKVTKDQVKEIAENKMKDLNAADVEAAMRMIEGTARSMGFTVED